MTINYGRLAVEEAVRAARTDSRRRQILDAAVTVMQKTGFHQMSMQDLAAEANVSVGLIYKYFGGKEDLLLATIVRIQDAFRDQLAPVIADAGVDPAARRNPALHRDRRWEPGCGGTDLSGELHPGRGWARAEQGTRDRQRRTTARHHRGRDRHRGVPRRRHRPADLQHHAAGPRLVLKEWHFGELYSLDEYFTLQTRYTMNSLMRRYSADE